MPASGADRKLNTHSRRKEAEILHPDGDHEEQQQLYLRIQHGKGQQQRKGQTVSAGRHAGKQAGQHSAHHAQQEIEGIAEIAHSFSSAVPTNQVK